MTTPKDRAALAWTVLALTGVCAVSGFGLAHLMNNAEGQGGGALWIVFPVIGVAIAHVVIGPTVLIMALVSRRLIAIIIIAAYFTAGVWSVVTVAHGRSPVNDARAWWNDRSERSAAARDFPAETALCDAIMNRFVAGGRGQSAFAPLPDTLEPGFDVGFRCRLDDRRIPRYVRRDYDHASVLQLAALLLESGLVVAPLFDAAPAELQAMLQRKEARD